MLEIACFNFDSAVGAAGGGADRIELCTNYTAGGLTPSLDTLHQIRKETTKPVNVMIRPRAGDFLYSYGEFEQMKRDIHTFGAEASGFVFGILDEHNRVDEVRNGELVKLAAPLPCTFHRAFDQLVDMPTAIEQLVTCGFRAILTSGGPSDAVTGASTVAQLQKDYGHVITIIIGGGVRSSNVGVLKEKTGVQWYHSAAILGHGEMVDVGEVERLQAQLITMA
jgi:copper homeostasis protein